MCRLALAALFLFAVGCGGDDDAASEDVQALCKQSASTVCAKIHMCFDGADAFTLGFGMNETECRTTIEARQNCAATTADARCPDKTYHPDKEMQCVTEFGALTCAQVEAGDAEPASCSEVCTD